MRGFLIAVLLAVSLFQVWTRPTYIDLEVAELYDVPGLFFLPSSEVIKFASLDFEEVAADVIWVRAIAYFSEEFLNRGDFRRLSKLIDTITDLDPRYDSVYLWAGSAFMYNGGRISEEDVLESNRYLHKAWDFYNESLVKWKIRKDFWRIPFMLGFNYAMELGEREKGAVFIEAAGQFPEAPSYVRTWTSTTLRKMGKKEAAFEKVKEQFTIETLRAGLETTQDEKVKEELRNRILYYYKLAGQKNATQEDVDRYEARIKRFYGDYFRSFSFLDLSFYSLLFPSRLLNEDSPEDLWATLPDVGLQPF